MAFRLVWNEGWDPGNLGMGNMPFGTAKVMAQAFDAVGYDHEYIVKEPGRDNEAYFRERIVDSIGKKGRPVIAVGVVGPPEPCIVSGYDEDGKVLIGWSFFQQAPDFKGHIDFEDTGYFRKGNWFNETYSLCIIGDKRQRPPLEQVYRDAIKWAVEVVRAPHPAQESGANGLDAYDAWADHIGDESVFSGAGMDTLRELHMVHSDATDTVAEGRWQASLFLKEIAGHNPDIAEELHAAAAAYQEEHDLMWRIWGLQGGIERSDEHIKAFAKPAVRDQMIPLIHEAKEKDKAAVECLERVLQSLS